MKKKTPEDKLNELLRKLNESGFIIELRDEEVLLHQAKKEGTRARTAVQIKGLIAPDQNTIYINEELSLEERVKTVLHEMIHLSDSDLSEEQTEELALDIYQGLGDDELGYLEFLVADSNR